MVSSVGVVVFFEIGFNIFHLGTHLDVFLTEEMSGRKLQDCPITSLKIGKNDVGLNELSTNSLLGVPTNDVDNGRKLRKSTAPRNV